MNHRPLPQGGQGLVGGLRGIDPHPRGGWRDQAGVQDRLGVGVLQHVLLGRVSLRLLVRPQPRAQLVGGAHRGALAIGRVEPGKGEPRLVPEEDQVGLDRQTFLHHPVDVVDDAIEGAVGQQQHPHAVQLAGGLEVQQLLLDLAQRDRTIHRIFVQRIAVEVADLRPSQHQPIMVRLVAVAIHEDDIVRPHKGLHDDLVAGRCAVGGKKGLFRPEGAACQFLRLLDRAAGFQQAVEPAGGGGGFGQKDVGPVEGAHVLDPVRPGDRLAPADRHGMKDARGLLGIIRQSREERRLVACLHTPQDIQVKLHEVFLIVEDAPADPQFGARNILHRPFCHQIGVEFRAHVVDQAAERRAEVLGFQIVQPVGAGYAFQEPRQDRVIGFGPQGHAGAHHDGLDIVVEQHRDQRILHRRHDKRFVDEGVFGPAHGVDIGFQPVFLSVGHFVHDQHLEIGLGHGADFGAQQRLVVVLLPVVAVVVKRDVPPPVRPRRQRAGDAVHAVGQFGKAVVFELAAHVIENGHAGKRPVGLDLGQPVEKFGRLAAQGRADLRRRLARKLRGDLAQFAPAVGPQLGG